MVPTNVACRILRRESHLHQDVFAYRLQDPTIRAYLRRCYTAFARGCTSCMHAAAYLSLHCRVDDEEISSRACRILPRRCSVLPRRSCSSECPQAVACACVCGISSPLRGSHLLCTVCCSLVACVRIFILRHAFFLTCIVDSIAPLATSYSSANCCLMLTPPFPKCPEF